MKVDYDSYYKDGGSVDKGHYVEKQCKCKYLLVS